MIEDEHPPRPLRRERPPPNKPSEWERVAGIFAAALERPRSERLQWLASLSGVDDALRAEVASLLDASDRAGAFLNPGEIRLLDPGDPPEAEPD